MRHALAFKTQSLLTLAGRFGRISPPAIAMQWQEWGNSGDCAGLGERIDAFRGDIRRRIGSARRARRRRQIRSSGAEHLPIRSMSSESLQNLYRHRQMTPLLPPPPFGLKLQAHGDALLAPG